MAHWPRHPIENKLVIIFGEFDTVFELCSPATLQRITGVCKWLRACVEGYTRRRFNINTHLALFFEHPLAFRALQRKLQFVISGSQALQFLDRTRYARSDLDLYCQPNDGPEIGYWLIKNGYEFCSWDAKVKDFDAMLVRMGPMPEQAAPEDMLHHYRIPGVRGVYPFKKRVQNDTLEAVDAHHANPDALEVQVIIAENTPIECILNFHTTIVMNFISWDKAYALYPRATFEERRALVTYSADKRFAVSMIKYAQRGFKILARLHAYDAVPGSGVFALGQRWVGDTRTWVLPLDTDGVEPVPESFPGASELDHWTLNGWELTKEDPTLLPSVHAACRMASVVLRPHIFRFRYCAPVDLYPIVAEFIKHQGALEVRKWNKALEEPGTGRGFGQPRPSFFTFWDAELLKYKRDHIEARRKLAAMSAASGTTLSGPETVPNLSASGGRSV